MEGEEDLTQGFVSQAIRQKAGMLGDITLALEQLRQIDLSGAFTAAQDLYTIAVKAQELLIVLDAYDIEAHPRMSHLRRRDLRTAKRTSQNHLALVTGALREALAVT